MEGIPMKITRKQKEEWQRRCAEAELVLEHAAAAFELIPIWALERKQQWMPSAEAIVILKRAKTSINDFAAIHWHGKSS